VKGCQEEKTFKKGTAHTTMYTQGLGQPRMNSEERVLDMMAQLDEHSEKIPEGMYLQFCDHLNFFYQNVQNKKKRLAAETERRSQLAQLAAETERRLRLATARQAIQVEEGRRNMFIDGEEREVVLREAEQRVLRRKVRGRRGENQRRGNMFIDDDLGEEQRDEEQDEMVALFARPRGPRRCGCCRQLGHNRRTCPQRVQ
jgi:hypothetical protein